MRCVGGSRTTRLHDGSRGDLGGSGERSIDLAQRRAGRGKLGG